MGHQKFARVGRPPLQSHKLGASQVQILDPHPIWKVIWAGPSTVLKTDGSRKRLEFDSTILPPSYLSKVLSGCIRGLGPCGPGSNPGRETSLRIVTAKINNTLLLKRKGAVRLRSRKVWCNGSTMLNSILFIYYRNGPSIYTTCSIKVF